MIVTQSDFDALIPVGQCTARQYHEELPHHDEAEQR